MVLAGRMYCYFCGSPAEWVHQLDEDKNSFTMYEKGTTFGTEIPVCEQCEGFYREGQDEVLIERLVQFQQTAAEDVDETARKPLRVLRAADLGAVVAVDDLLPPGAAELRAQGFTPVEELTGLACIGELWPVDHRRGVPETRPNRGGSSPGGMFWLVRSPWEWITTDDLISTMMWWVDGGLPPEGGQIGLLIRERIARFLAFDEQAIHQMREA